MIRRIVVGLVIVLVSILLGVILTLSLLPLWRLIEEKTGIESIGHSGPADWCYLVCIAGCALALGFIYIWAARRGGPSR